MATMYMYLTEWPAYLIVSKSEEQLKNGQDYVHVHYVDCQLFSFVCGMHNVRKLYL